MPINKTYVNIFKQRLDQDYLSYEGHWRLEDWE